VTSTASPAGSPAVFVRVPHAWCHASASAIAEVADATEEFGFDGVSVQDHLLSDSGVTPCGGAHGHDDRSVLEAMAVLNFLAGRTRRLRLLSGVLVLPYRSPVLLAKEIATLDNLSGGRLTLGVGVGAVAGRQADAEQQLSAHARIAQREFQAMGVRGDRGSLMDEMLEAMIALWEHDSASFHGRHVNFEGLDLYPKPVQQPHPPVWIGGRSEAALRRVARIGDGWFPSQASPDLIVAGRARITEFVGEVGRAVPVDQGVNLFASIAKDGAAARAVIVAALGRRFKHPDALWNATLSGNPDEVLDQMRAYIAAGVTAFDVKLLPLGIPETLAQLQLLADTILPALRSERLGEATA